MKVNEIIYVPRNSTRRAPWIWRFIRKLHLSASEESVTVVKSLFLENCTVTKLKFARGGDKIKAPPRNKTFRRPKGTRSVKCSSSYNSTFSRYTYRRYILCIRGAHVFKKSKSHLKGNTMFHVGDLQILGVTVQTSVDRTTWSPIFVHPGCIQYMHIHVRTRPRRACRLLFAGLRWWNLPTFRNLLPPHS